MKAVFAVLLSIGAAMHPDRPGNENLRPEDVKIPIQQGYSVFDAPNPYYNVHFGHEVRDFKENETRAGTYATLRQFAENVYDKLQRFTIASRDSSKMLTNSSDQLQVGYVNRANAIPTENKRYNVNDRLCLEELETRNPITQVFRDVVTESAHVFVKGFKFVTGK